MFDESEKENFSAVIKNTAGIKNRSIIVAVCDLQYGDFPTYIVFLRSLFTQ